MAPTPFEPQPLTAPLNDDALRSLGELQQQRDREKNAREQLKKAAQYLTDITGELNDRAYLRKARHSKERARRREARGTENEAEENEDPALAEADAKYEEFQRRVEALTKRMDLSIRGAIDDMTWLADYPETLKTVVEKAQESTEEQRSNFHTRSATPSRRTRQRRVSDDDDNNDDNNDEEGGEHNQNEEEDDTETGPSSRPSHRTTALPTIHPADTPHIHLSTALTRQSRTWTSKSLTERYARNNDYRGWYRVLYDAKNPGESAPPMPDESLWFAAEEGRGIFSSSQRQRGHRHALDRGQGSHAEAGTTGAGPSDDDDEVEIAAEKTRLKCPITLLPYVDPVTSQNCNHSYERAAILSMLGTSTNFAPLTPSQLGELSQLGERQRSRREREIRIKQVKCPECNVPLVEDDLVENPALKRRVARLLAKERADDNIATSDVEGAGDDDADDDDVNAVADIIPGTQRRPVGVGSSPLAPSSALKAEKQIKAERMSAAGVIRHTQLADEARTKNALQQNINAPAAARPPHLHPPPRGRDGGRGMQIMDLDDDDDAGDDDNGRQ